MTKMLSKQYRKSVLKLTTYEIVINDSIIQSYQSFLRAGLFCFVDSEKVALFQASTIDPGIMYYYCPRYKFPQKP